MFAVTRRSTVRKKNSDIYKKSDEISKKIVLLSSTTFGRLIQLRQSVPRHSLAAAAVLSPSVRSKKAGQHLQAYPR